MTKPWQFNIKSMLIVIAALSVPLCMIARGDDATRFWGVLVLIPTIGGSMGFLAAKWAGIWPGIIIALLIMAALIPFFLLL